MDEVNCISGLNKVLLFRMFKFVVDPCSKETGSKLYFTMQARLWWQHLVTCEPFFFFFILKQWKLQMKRTFFLSWLPQQMLNVSSKKCAEAFLWSFLESFSLIKHGLWATGNDKLWALAHLPKFSCQYTFLCCTENFWQNNLWQQPIKPLWD